MCSQFGRTVVKQIKVYFRVKTNVKKESESRHGTFQNKCTRQGVESLLKGLGHAVLGILFYFVSYEL